MADALRDIEWHGRPHFVDDRTSSAMAMVLVRRGLAERSGLQWSRFDSTKQVASYALTEAGRSVLNAETERRAQEELEPFCACGRVISRCDGSRRGCGKGTV